MTAERPVVCRGRTVLASSILAFCLVAQARAAFEITTGAGSTAQNFDTLASSGTGNPFTNDTTLTPGDSTLDGWSLFNHSGLPIGAYNAGSGTSTTGSFYSFGKDASDRALGGLGSGGTYFGSPASGSVAGFIAFAATNNSTSTLTSFTLGFNGEQWRNSNASPQTMTLEYGFGATFDAVTWTAPGGKFDWSSPVVGGTVGSVDGNNAGLVRDQGGTINGLSWGNGQTLWLRWVELNDAGNDHALAIDNFALSWTGAVISPLYWDTNGATAGIGGTGTWNSTSLNWNPTLAGTGTAQTADASKRLVFGGSGGTITVDAAGVAANIGMEFEAPYTLNGGTITVGNIATISANAPVTINAPIAGGSGLIKLGTDRLTLTNAANVFAGVISINAGVLVVSGDSQLGAADNDVVLSGGVLEPASTLVMNAGRALSGNGGVKIHAGNTLTTQGTVNISDLDLSSDSANHSAGGTLALNGGSNLLGNVTFSDPATVTSTTNLKLNGNVTMGSSIAGPVAMSAPTINLTGAVQRFTVVDTPAAVDATITGALGGVGKLHKIGTGTLRLVGDNTSFPGGVRIGTAGATTEPGGKLIISDNGALGTNGPLDFQFNDGTLQADLPLTGAAALPVGVSFGAGAIGEGTFTGSPIEFLGDLALFKATGTSLEHKMRLETDVTFRGFGASQGTGGSSGLLLTGTGTLTFSGTAGTATPAVDTINIEGPTIVVNGAMTGATINVRAGSLKGVGPLGGITTVGDGTGNDDANLSPGNGVGVLGIGGLALDTDARLQVELDRLTATADKIVADGPVELGVGTATLALSILNSGALAPGTVFLIIDNSSTGTTTGRFQGLADDSSFVVDGLPFTINYNAGADSNDVVLTYVPEPRSGILLAPGFFALAGLRRRQNHTIA